MSVFTSLNYRVVRAVKRRNIWIKILIVVGIILILWRPTFLFGDGGFFLPRQHRQVLLRHGYVHDARHVCVVDRRRLDSGQRGPDLILLVLTTPGRTEYRRAIRETYGSLTRGGVWPRKPESPEIRQVDNSIQNVQELSVDEGSEALQRKPASPEIRDVDGSVRNAQEPSMNKGSRVGPRQKKTQRIRHLDGSERNVQELSVDEGSSEPQRGHGTSHDSGTPRREATGSVRLVFLLGQTKNAANRDAEAQQVALESERFGDVVQWEGLEEDYSNLTYKVLLGFRWVKEFCSSARFVVKVDDDTFLHIPRLFRHIQRTYGSVNGVDKSQRLLLTRFPHESYRADGHRRFWLGSAASSARSVSLRHGMIHGRVLPHSLARRWGKYGVSFETYPFLFYPPYTRGNFYFMKTSVAARILSIAEYIPYNNMEDVHVTGTLAHAAGVRHLGLSDEEVNVRDVLPTDCSFAGGLWISTHGVSPSMHREIWTSFTAEKNICRKSQSNSVGTS
ncbi:uncharacterized protein [Littorina saxatilis]|uniref:uncharacterized protein n=1 Tax=Littorina saxatilis TaxID=31220 RepID=UPI0038B6AAA0